MDIEVENNLMISVLVLYNEILDIIEMVLNELNIKILDKIEMALIFENYL